MSGSTYDEFIENDFVELWIQDDIVFEKFKPTAIMDMTAGRQVVSARLQISNKRLMPILVDIRNLVSVESKTRKWMASSEALQYLSAGGFIIDNVLARLAFNTFLKFDKPKIPTRAFPNYEKALKWLEFYKNPN